MYRMAASAILVLVLSAIAFVDGCAVDSLLIILLALFNDISMLPVAYDKADATSKPQLPNTLKLFLMSIYYGLFHTSLSLMFVFTVSYSTSSMDQNIDLRLCDEVTRGFVWMHLVLVTELAIFSVRAPSYFWSSSMPSIWLIVSVLATCIGCCFIAVYASGLSGLNLLWIWLFNIGSLIVVDIGKVQFRGMIGDAPGDIIESDELVSVDEKKTDVEKFQAKQKRYSVHRDSALDPADLQHSVRVGRSSIFDMRDSLTEGIRFTQPGARLQYSVGVQKGILVRSRMKTVSAPELTFRS